MPTEKNAAFLPTQYSFKLDRQRVKCVLHVVLLLADKYVTKQHFNIG